jgi:hypothetical protein
MMQSGFGVGDVFTGRLPGGGEREIAGAHTPGQIYYVPDAPAKKRIAGYINAEVMMDPKNHLAAFKSLRTGTGGVDSDTEKFWIPLDFPGMFGRLMRDYTVSQEFHIRARALGNASGDNLEDAQATVNRITKASHLGELLKQTTEALPVYGDAVLRLDIEDKVDEETGVTIPQAMVRYVKPTHYFPEVNPLDKTRIDGITLAWVFPFDAKAHPRKGVQTRTGDMMVLREIHTPGEVAFHLHRWDGAKVGAKLNVKVAFPELEDYSTGIDEIPLLHLGFQVKAGEHFGESEVNRITPLVLSLENRLAQVDEVLEKHARPKLIVGPGILDSQGRANLRDFDVIEVSPDIFEKAVKPEYLTWNTQLTGAEKEIEKLEEYLFMISETSPASFGLERDGSQVESARALRFKAHRTVNKVQDVRVVLAHTIESIFRIGQKMELAALKDDGKNGYKKSGVTPHFGDPILEDQTQEVEDYVARKHAGLVSTKRAVRDLDNLTPNEADAELDEILQDRVDEAAAGAATFHGSPATTAGAAVAVKDELETGGEEEGADLTGDPGLGVQSEIQKNLPNGGQMKALIDTIVAVASGRIPRDSGVALLEIAYGMSSAEANSVLSQAGTPEFEATKPTPFGGGGGDDKTDEETGEEN